MEYPDKIISPGLFPLLILILFFFVVVMAGVNQLGLKRAFLTGAFVSLLVAVPFMIMGILQTTGFFIMFILLAIGIFWSLVDRT